MLHVLGVTPEEARAQGIFWDKAAIKHLVAGEPAAKYRHVLGGQANKVKLAAALTPSNGKAEETPHIIEAIPPPLITIAALQQPEPIRALAPVQALEHLIEAHRACGSNKALWEALVRAVEAI